MEAYKTANERFSEQLREQTDVALQLTVDAGDVLPDDELDIPSLLLEAALRENWIFAVPVRGRLYYPAFFVNGKYDRQKLEQVCKALGGLSGAEKWAFFRTPLHSLASRSPEDLIITAASGDRDAALELMHRGRTPLDAIKAGVRLSLLHAAAREYGSD